MNGKQPIYGFSISPKFKLKFIRFQLKSHRRKAGRCTAHHSLMRVNNRKLMEGHKRRVLADVQLKSTVVETL